MDYSPWSSKNLIARNRLKKFMQVGVDVTFFLNEINTKYIACICLVNSLLQNNDD